MRGRTAYMIKATLLSYGYIVMIKATIYDRECSIKSDYCTYQSLAALQGNCIPICLGLFSTNINIQYRYHGARMRHMLVLSWCIHLQETSDKTRGFLEMNTIQKLNMLRAYGANHQDGAWRNILWNSEKKTVFIIDLENIAWGSPQPLPQDQSTTRSFAKKGKPPA